METIRRLQFWICKTHANRRDRCCIYNIFRWIYLVSSYFELRTCSLAETHYVCQYIIMLVAGLIPICAVARQSRPTIKMDV